MVITRVHHHTLTVSDMDRSIEFYRDLLGFPRLRDAGVRFTSEPVDVVRDGKLAARLVYAFDPDDIVVELYQPVE